MKRQKDMTPEDKSPRLVGVQYATEEEQRNSSGKNEETEPKQQHHPVMDVIHDGSKDGGCKAQYCIGTWNVRPMIQGKLEVVNRKWQE